MFLYSPPSVIISRLGVDCIIASLLILRLIATPRDFFFFYHEPPVKFSSKNRKSALYGLNLKVQFVYKMFDPENSISF